MYIIVMRTCELVGLVAQQSGTSTLRWRTTSRGLLGDVTHAGPMRERVAQRSCDDVIEPALLTLLFADGSKQKKTKKTNIIKSLHLAS